MAQELNESIRGVLRKSMLSEVRRKKADKAQEMVDEIAKHAKGTEGKYGSMFGKKFKLITGGFGNPKKVKGNTFFRVEYQDTESDEIYVVTFKIDRMGYIDAVRGQINRGTNPMKYAKDLRIMSSADKKIEPSIIKQPKKIFAKWDNLGISPGPM